MPTRPVSPISNTEEFFLEEEPEETAEQFAERRDRNQRAAKNLKAWRAKRTPEEKEAARAAARAEYAANRKRRRKQKRISRLRRLVKDEEGTRANELAASIRWKQKHPAEATRAITIAQENQQKKIEHARQITREQLARLGLTTQQISVVEHLDGGDYIIELKGKRHRERWPQPAPEKLAKPELQRDKPRSSANREREH